MHKGFLPTDNFHSIYSLYNIQNKHLLTNDLEIHFVEIAKWEFNKIKDMKRLDRWMAYFTNKVSEKEMEEIVMQEPAIQKAIEIESIFTQDEILRREYEQREKAIMDYTSAMSASKRIGIKEGFEQGAEEKAMETAIAMLKDNMSFDLIEKYSGIPIDKIKTLNITKQN